MTDGFVSALAVEQPTAPAVFTIPAGVQGQDIAILAVACSTTSIAVDAGWSPIGASPYAPVSGETQAVYRKVMSGAAGSASPDIGTTVTATQGSAVKIAGVLSFWRAVDPSHAVNASAYNPISPTGGQTTFAGDSVTTLADNCVILTVFMNKNSSNPINYTPPAGYTLRGTAALSSGTGKSDVVVASKTSAAAGNYGADSWTADATPGSAGVFTIALSPLSTTQTVYPSSVVSSSGVNGVGDVTNLYNNVNSPAPDGTHYNESISGGDIIYQVPSITNPGNNTGWSCPYILGLSGAAASATYTLKLKQGTTVIESWTETCTADGQVFSHALSSTNVATIIYTTGAAVLRLEATLTAVS